MKRIEWMVIVLGTAFFVQTVVAEMRAFTLEDGRVLEAEIVDYNAKIGKVTLKRPDGKRIPVKPDLFIDADQKYIEEWAMLDGFLSTSVLKVNCKKKSVEKWKKENDAFQTQFQRFTFEVGFENRHASTIEKMDVEYRIFYEQEKNDQSRKVVNTKLVKSGTLDLDHLSPREKRTLTTESVVLEEFEFNMTDYYFTDGDPESTHGEIKGIWLRLHVKTPSGQEAFRNIFEPQSIRGKYVW